jgi:hypothetical protein
LIAGRTAFLKFCHKPGEFSALCFFADEGVAVVLLGTTGYTAEGSVILFGAGFDALSFAGSIHITEVLFGINLGTILAVDVAFPAGSTIGIADEIPIAVTFSFIAGLIAFDERLQFVR